MKENTQGTVGTESRAPEQEIEEIVRRMEIAFQVIIIGCVGTAVLVLVSLLWT